MIQFASKTLETQEVLSEKEREEREKMSDRREKEREKGCNNIFSQSNDSKQVRTFLDTN